MARNNHDSAPPQINLIAEGTSLEGTLRAGDDIRISGTIDGTLHVDGKAIVAEEGTLEGDLHAGDADVAGTVSGEIHVKGRLILKSTARVNGKIRTSRLIVEEGATFDGECQMGQLDKKRAAELKAESGDAKASGPELKFSNVRQ